MTTLVLFGDGYTGRIRFLADPSLIPAGKPYTILQPLRRGKGDSILCAITSRHHGAQPAIPSELLRHLADDGLVAIVPQSQVKPEPGLLTLDRIDVDGIRLEDGACVLTRCVYR